MPSFSVARFGLFAALLCGLFLPFTTGMFHGLMSDDNSLGSKEYPRALPNTGRVGNFPSSIFAGSKSPYPENFRYKIPRSAKYIVFHGWGDEFPVFDDVADILDRAEDDLDRDRRQAGGDQPVRRVRTWTFETAHLVVKNDQGGDGVTHRELIEFLRGLGEFGRQYGFFTCRMTFYNDQFTVDRRAIAEISVYTGPRAVARRELGRA
ncbi:MAG: hypothetical protein Q9216_002632 [Gyalolechia sp. 2 TL-2023]